jgi:NADH:ubiquinone oxidoreductase subunit E
MSTDIDLSLMDPIVERYQEQGDSLITVLQDIQAVYSYLPEIALTNLSDKTGIALARIFSVATFYAQFYLTPRGRNTIKICCGTACHVRGAPRILDALERELGIQDGETTEDLEYSLEKLACIGACALAPTMLINETTYGKMTPDKVTKAINTYENKEQEIE